VRVVNATVWIGLLGAVMGAAASTLGAWLAQRGELRRQMLQRDYQERTLWRDEKRVLFRDVQSATLDWMRLLRRIAVALVEGNEEAVGDEEVLAMERKFHLLGYEVDLLAELDVCTQVEELEDTLRIWTRKLGKPTDFKWPKPYEVASPEVARVVATEVLDDDFLQIDEARIRALRAMRTELGATRD
jgi:hypothetical protein